MFNKILVAVDGSEMAGWAVETAGRLAQALGSRLAIIQVTDVMRNISLEYEFAAEEILSRQEKAGTDLLIDAQENLPSGVISERMLRTGDPATEILKAASSWRADLIVMGTHGRGRVIRLMLGSVTDVVIRNASCPVMTVGAEPRPLVGAIAATADCRVRAAPN